VRRREFITLLGGAAAWPLAARAQQPMPVIGFLHGGSAVERVHLIAAFRQGLGAAGYVEGQNVMIEYRWADNQFDRLPGLAAELVRHQAKVIATPGGSVATVAAKATTTTIPIIFGSENDPIKAGLVRASTAPAAARPACIFSAAGWGKSGSG
jgi:putative ABC transport system substrate-binding protein